MHLTMKETDGKETKSYSLTQKSYFQCLNAYPTTLNINSTLIILNNFILSWVLDLEVGIFIKPIYADTFHSSC